MTRPTMLITPYGRAVLAFPFDRWLVDALKAEIPAYCRTYDPVTKQWTVEQPYIATAQRILRTVFPDAEIRAGIVAIFERSRPHKATLQTLHTASSAIRHELGLHFGEHARDSVSQHDIARFVARHETRKVAA